MKPVAFEYESPSTIEEVVELLAASQGLTKILAGGQSLGPMMNLRLVRPSLLIDIKRISELTRVWDDGDAQIIGAGITHAQIEDGKVPDFTGGMMQSVASGIAYRAVRNAGTIGGSLAHADPSADWITCLSAIGADVTISGANGDRRIPVDQLMMSTFETALAPAELLVSIRVPKMSSDAQWGFKKFCRKTGEMAVAMSAAIVDPRRSVARVVIGATDTRPVVVPEASKLLSSPAGCDSVIAESGFVADPIAAQIHRTVLRRTIEEVTSS